MFKLPPPQKKKDIFFLKLWPTLPLRDYNLNLNYNLNKHYLSYTSMRTHVIAFSAEWFLRRLLIKMFKYIYLCKIRPPNCIPNVSLGIMI